MNTDLKAKWISALRSGEFEQGDGLLHNQSENTYCCLGVLCKVMGAEFGPATVQTNDEEFPRTYNFVPHVGDKILSNGYSEELNDSLCLEIDMPDQTKLIQMNDGNIELGIDKHSFSEIADYIEKNL